MKIQVGDIIVTNIGKRYVVGQIEQLDGKTLIWEEGANDSHDFSAWAIPLENVVEVIPK